MQMDQISHPVKKTMIVGFTLRLVLFCHLSKKTSGKPIAFGPAWIARWIFMACQNHLQKLFLMFVSFVVTIWQEIEL